MPKASTLLVTGGAGFIGSNFIHYWLKNHPEDTIINYDALTYAGNPANLKDLESHSQYRFVHGNICDGPLLDSVLKDCDIVVHFAAESHVDRSILDPAIFLQTNVMGTEQLLRSSVAAKIKHFHHISTDEVFGSLELDSSEKFSETTHYAPRSPYAASKAGSDHLVRAYGETYGLSYTISNCSNNYGPYHFPEKLLPLAITNIIDDEPVPIYGDGMNVRDWLYVEDHCRAIELIVQSKRHEDTFVVGGMEGEINNHQLITLLLKLMNKPDSLITWVPDRPGHDRKYQVDWTHIKQELGWTPQVTLEEGLAATIKWYQEHEAWWRPLKEAESAYFSKQYQAVKE